MMFPTATRARRRSAMALVSVIAAALVVMLASVRAGADTSHAEIDGDGSSWSANAINIWVAQVSQNGLKVVFTPNGSAQGRKDFANGTNDFAVSDIGFLGKDPITGDPDNNCGINGCRPYAYLPVVAGGTSFPYHIEVAGKLVRNLRLSGQTLAKIFTGQITDWSDPQITADNNGQALPALPIIPVTHSEGSGSTYQFTAYLNQQYPSIWNTAASAATEYFPQNIGQEQQFNGSDGIMNFITSAAGNGAIGYDEYSYAVNKNYPVAKLENQAGYYTLPTQYNVAVALQQAQINMDPTSPNYLLENLSNVYTDPDPRAYAMSSYSYIIIPTGATNSATNPTPEQRMTLAKRQTIADFLTYSVCDGQGLVGADGYSSLPLNLVQASLGQLSKLQQADPGVDLSHVDVTKCNNPTFVPGNLSANHLADIDPPPLACDQSGQGPCSGTPDPGTGSAPAASPGAAASSAPSAAVGRGSPSGGKTTGADGGVYIIGIDGKPTKAKAATATTSGSAGGSVSSGQTVANTRAASGAGQATSAKTAAAAAAQDPDLGSADGAGDSAGGSGATATSGSVSGVPTNLVAYRQQDMTRILAPLTVLEMIAVLVGPPIFYVYVIRRRRARR